MQQRTARQLAQLAKTCRQPQLFWLNFGYLVACLPLMACLTGLISPASLVLPASFAVLGGFGLWMALTHPPKGHATPGTWAIAALLPGAGLALAMAHSPGAFQQLPDTRQTLRPA
ncbi:MAG: hypothetical protein WCC57_07470 [Paracoccaceae bacterium]